MGLLMGQLIPVSVCLHQPPATPGLPAPQWVKLGAVLLNTLGLDLPRSLDLPLPVGGGDTSAARHNTLQFHPAPPGANSNGCEREPTSCTLKST